MILTRNDLIKRLIADWHDTLHQEVSAVDYLLINGFAGFASYTDQELWDACDEAGLIRDGDDPAALSIRAED